MPPYNAFFAGILFFIIGIFLTNIHGGWLTFFVPFGVAVITAFLFYFQKLKKYFTLLCLSPLIFCGSFYAAVLNMNFTSSSAKIPYEVKSTFRGKISEVKTSDFFSTQAVINLIDGGSVLATMPRYSPISVGDFITFEGTIKRPQTVGYAHYLAKEGIGGVLNYPTVISVNSGGGLQKALFLFRQNIVGTIQKLFPEKESAFLSGLLVGYRGGFSEDFNAAMQTSGTTHLVALSGYNVSLVVIATMSLFSFFFPRLLSLCFTVIAVVLFVVMTGAEPSVVRAAVMGFLILFATESGRFFDVRNVVIFTAFLMLLKNPKLLIFDIGFALSFASLLGILYVKPVLWKEKWQGNGFLEWRENITSTCAAQIVTLPIIGKTFGLVSLLSIVSNVLILGFIPLTMAIGFADVAVYFLSKNLSAALTFVLFPLLKFETSTIEFFGHLPAFVPVRFGSLGVGAYYAALAAFVLWKKKKETCF